MAAQTMLVRLKPYNKKKGHILRRYSYRGIRFQEGRGWYRVGKELADYLGTVHQIPGDEDTPPAFDVCTEAEAKAIDKKEAQDARQATPAEEATDVTAVDAEGGGSEGSGGDLTTEDLPESRRSSRKKSGSRR